MNNSTPTWKPLLLENLDENERFEVSDYGELRKWNESDQEYFLVKLSKVTGYYTFYVKLNNGKRAIKYLHRVLAETFLKKENPNQVMVIHLDYNKLNNRIDNLQWADRNQQMLHQKNNPNIIHRGRKHGYKIQPDDVQEIFRLVEEEEISKAAVARKYGVSPTQIRRILARKNWNDVEVTI